MTVLGRVEPFVLVAERRSFRGAARQLGVTPAAVSKAVAALEAELGVRLLNRTTRHVAPTPEGEVFLRHCRDALDRVQAGRDQITHDAQVAQGLLKVSMSSVLGRPVVAALPRLLSRYPRIRVHLSFDDVPVNLVEQEVDVALRTGELADSSLVARRVGVARWVTVASPTYLARAGEPQEPAELAAHTCLQFARPTGQLAGWRFLAPGGGELPPFVAERPVVLDRGDLLVDAAVAGVGVAQVFDFMARDRIRAGELVELWPARAAEGPAIHALCVAGRQRVPKIRAFLDFAGDVLG